MHFKIETIVGLFIIAATALFFYISFQLGSMRLDLARYATYTVDFKDVSGLTERSDIKIAGVKVGWVEKAVLLSDARRVRLTLKILKEYPLYADATALVRQEGLLGVKFLEVISGDPTTVRILSGGTLPAQVRQFVSMDEIFYSFQKIAQQVERLGTSLEGTSAQAQELLSEIKERFAKLSDASELSLEQFKETALAIKKVAHTVQASLEDVQIPLKQATTLVQSVQDGKGSLGQLLKDPTIYEDIKYTADYAKGCIDRIRCCSFALDSHLEVLPQAWQHCPKTNLKWYTNGWFYPSPSFFGVLGLVYSQQGFAKREKCTCNGQCSLCIKERRDGFRLNLQAGGCLPCGLWGRLGIFEGTAGVALDYWLPFERFSWLTTFEAFDFKGHNRFGCDRAAHLKWLNRFYFNPSFYLSFGVDDFISKHRTSGFIGLGACFSTGDFWR